MKALLQLCSLFVILLFGLVLSGLAQAPVGDISGSVFDESGAVIPNAQVTITNKETGLIRNVVINVAGQFSASALPAGHYEVKVEVSGFRTLTARGWRSAVGGLTTVDMHLQVGAVQGHRDSGSRHAPGRIRATLDRRRGHPAADPEPALEWPQFPATWRCSSPASQFPPIARANIIARSTYPSSAPTPT